MQVERRPVSRETGVDSRSVLPHLGGVRESAGGLDDVRLLLQRVRGEAFDLAFLTASQGLLMLSPGPH